MAIKSAQTLVQEAYSEVKTINIDDAFNVVINNGEEAGMTVPHLHLHILSGKKLSFTA